MRKIILVERRRRATDKPAEKASWESIAKIVGLAATLFTVIFSVLQYRKTESWKRQEFIISQFNGFKNNNYVKAANHLLDYNEGTVKIDSGKTETFDNLQLFQALRDQEEYSDKQYQFREVFDHYFDELSTFNRYIHSGLITFEEIEPYFKYQIDIIADTTNQRKGNVYRYVLWDYIQKWHFDDIVQLCHLYGYDITKHSD